jgi:TPP-dependent pyruvate/acetoin dehydrogenase alpha subunit
VERQERRLRELDVDVDAVRAEVSAEIDAAATEALAGPMPTPDDVLEGVFCSGDAEPLGDGRAPWSGYAGSPAVEGGDA